MICVLGGCVDRDVTSTLTTAQTTVPTTIPIEYLESQEELLALFAAYQANFGTFAYSSPEAQATLPDSSDQVFSGEGINIDRDVLPDQPDPENLRMTPNYKKIFAAGITLSQAYNVVSSCSAYVENTFCTLVAGELEHHIRVHYLGETLTIDWYTFEQDANSELPFQSVTAYRIVFDRIDGKLRVELVRDDRRITEDEHLHHRWYDRFEADGGCLNIALDMMRDEEKYYHSYDVAAGEYYWFQSTRFFGTEMSYTDLASGVTIVGNYGLDDAMTSLSLSFGYRQTVFSFTEWFTSEPHQARLGWNLYRVSGWDQAVLYTSESDRILAEGVWVLEDAWIKIDLDPADPIAMAYLMLPVADIDEAVVDLSAYGLGFDAISSETLMWNVMDGPTALLNAKNRHGLSFDDATDQATLLALFPFDVDEAFIESLWR